MFFIIAPLVMLAIHHVDAYQDATPQHYSLYLLAQYNQLQHEETALTKECYQQLFKQNAPVFTYAGYFEHLYTLGNYSDIIRLIPQTKGYFDNQKDIQVIIGQSLELAGKGHEAEDVFIKLYQHCKNHADIAYYAAAAYTRRNAFSQALTVIDDYLNSSVQRPTHFMFYFLKSKIYQFLNNEKDAVENLKKGLDLYKSVRGVAYSLPIDTELPLVSYLINEAFYVFDASLKYTTAAQQQRKLVTLWKKLHS